MNHPATAPAFQVYARDWLADSRFVVASPPARGALFTLLLHDWLDGSVPGDPRGLAALLRMAVKVVERILPEIEPFFERRGNRLVFPEHEQQRAHHAAWREKQRQAGIASGAARAKRANGGSTTVHKTANGGSTTVEPNTNSAYCNLRTADSLSDAAASKRDDARAFLDLFRTKYLQRFSSEYFVLDRDVRTAQELLDAYGERLPLLVDELFAVDSFQDEWIAHSDRSISILAKKAGWLDGRLRGTVRRRPSLQQLQDMAATNSAREAS